MHTSHSIYIYYPCSFQEFYENLNRVDMYIRYVYKLCDLHVACENFTEAGSVLLSHARLLDVSGNFNLLVARFFQA